jgi:hypothetical protein
MHLHENPNGGAGDFPRNAALQINVVSFDELVGRASGRAAGAMLYSICSF